MSQVRTALMYIGERERERESKIGDTALRYGVHAVNCVYAFIPFRSFTLPVLNLLFLLATMTSGSSHNLNLNVNLSPILTPTMC